ncbi:MAG: hypothetical protein GQ580_01960 [Candidatus Thorarchaeota archaeon]|nr:hypothetical protein [Candidatus Thorarchaeota archaeon]
MLIVLAAVSLLFISSMTTVSAEGENVVSRGETITITAQLLQNGTYGDPVVNQRIEFFDQTHDSFLGSDMTDSNGLAYIDWPLPSEHPLGFMMINATFRGNQSLSLSPSCQWMPLTVVSATTMEIQVKDSDLAPGDDLNLIVRLLNDMNESLSGASLMVFSDSLPLGSGITNDTGCVSFSFHCNTSWAQLGANTVSVVYEGNLALFQKGVETSFSITVEQIATLIKHDNALSDIVTLNDSITLSLTLWANEETLPNGLMMVSLDGTTQSSITTNGSGVATLDLRINEGISLNNHTLIIEYTGTDRYSISILQIHFIVTSPVLIEAFLPEYIVTGTELEISVVVQDILNRPIPGASITILDTLTEKAVTEPLTGNSNSTQLFLPITGPKGIREFIITVNDAQYVTNGTYWFSEPIWFRPTLSLNQSNILGFASPQQEILLVVHLINNNANYSNKLVEVHSINSTLISQSITNQVGIATMAFLAPSSEGHFVFLIVCSGNESAYELSVILEYSFTVAKTIPVIIIFDYYEIIPQLKEIYVQLTIQGLNGSLLRSIPISYGWLSANMEIDSSNHGLISLHLAIPSTAGSYLLSYESEASGSLQSYAGSAVIVIGEADVSAAQGIGIVALAIGSCLSISLVSIPLIRRRYMLT